MKLYSALRKSAAILCLILLTASFTDIAFGAPFQKTTNTGGVRGGSGQTVRVTVKLGSKSVPSVRVNVMTSDGSVVTSGLTNKHGVYTAPLDAGDYTLSITSPKGNATHPVTVVKSSDPAMITLTLTPPAS